MSTLCPSCGSAAAGRFCSSCGTALAGAVCNNCSAPLTVGAHFCHRCGTPSGSASPTSRGMASGLPWAVAAIALVALIALVVGQRFGSRGTSAPESSAENAVPQSAPFAGATGSMPRAPDISQLTPAQRAERLYDRIMRESEAGNTENVRAFMPMAIQAYDMIGPLNLDQRYDLGRLGEVAGDSALARAEADTILAARPTHLLGLALAARAARMENSTARAQAFDVKLLAAEPAERKVGLPEYLLHNNDIQTAVAAARASNK